MKKKLCIGILLGLLFLFLAARNIDLNTVCRNLRLMHFGYIIPVVLALLSMHSLRAYRWGVLLKPIERIHFFSLLSVTCVGFMAIMVFPARVGEFARPYLITRKSGVRMSTALGSIVIERLFDTFSILIMLSMVAWFVSLPRWLVSSSIVVFILVVISMTLIILIILNRPYAYRVAAFLLQKAPRRFAAKLEGWFSHFLNGFEVVNDIRRIAIVMGLSFLIWSIGALVIYILFFAFDFSLSPIAAFTVLAIVVVGITVPTAPGFVGNWHYFCVLALAFFNIPKSDAMAFAIAHHSLSLSVTLLLGLIFLPFNDFSFSSLKK